ncbi:glycosyltransferase involved in cell wall biosynthesis [Sphingobium sp. OAS761]|uniref:class I SAM-dependent methyltransferase n=1 Tax=Sphingobium sp. OAS761 TaxID=2817901 RepID=UPI00209E4C8C|nr:class I SAM-dependent methyltransferase [Sphingobium sp. OAS761]MCP1468913.1 glycosyltransferase involved in cell wall biosynthesis [Sphingobium sp. OAS761]
MLLPQEIVRARPGHLPHDLSDIGPVMEGLPATFDALMARISGGITVEEARFLHRMAAELRHGCIVEVGSFRGKSAVAMALGAQASAQAGEPATHLYCIEPHMPFTGIYAGTFGPEDRKEFYRAMLATGAYRTTSLVNLSSEDVADRWQRPVGMAFIDGDHSYEGVKRDFDCWHRHILPGGLLIFDDARDPEGGPARLIAELLPSDQWRKVPATGKFVALRKAGGAREEPASLEILVPCNRLTMAGGILRFDRLARAIARRGHRLSFLPLSPSRGAFRPFAGMVTEEQARERRWDAVMIPGAGFPAEAVERFSQFRDPRYGVRVQHVLNDQTRRSMFEAVNAALDPDLVIFNNAAWPAGSYTKWRGRQFHVLEGAVDIDLFSPPSHDRPFARRDRAPGRVVVGGQASKNAAPLIEALSLLPEHVCLSLFGPDPQKLAAAHADLIAAGRLTLTGSLADGPLRQYYHGLDVAIATETYAGWSNLSAEAAACGVPLICTRPGTHAFARDGETALLLDDATPAAIADAVRAVIDDPDAALARAARARSVITGFDWDGYGERLLGLIAAPVQSHYFRSEEIGLFGKWDAGGRLDGLDRLFAECAGLDIVDLGAAEGLVSLQCLAHGARSVTGFELDPGRVALAQALVEQRGHADRASFHAGDLSDWRLFRATQGDRLKDRYDAVLYLGIHQHLHEAQDRMASLAGALSLAGRWFVIRTPDRFWRLDRIDAHIRAAGWVPRAARAQEGPGAGQVGELRIYERTDRT